VREAKNFITAAGLENSAAKLFPRDTVLVAMYGATAGQVGILRFEAATNQAVCGILPNDKFVPEFLYYSLLAKKDDLVAQATGNAQPNISQIKIKNTAVPVLPLPEQQRIVALLDEAFAGLATAKANAERNLQNARAIFESHLQSVFSQRGEGWPTKQLGEVCDFQGGSQPPKSEFVYEPRAGYVRFLQIRDYASDRHLTYIPESSKNRLCNADDIMIGRYGASVGKILTSRAGAYNVALVKTIPDLRVLDRDFFFNYLASGAFQGCLADVAARSAQNGFSKDDIYGFPVPAPPLSEQRMMIEQLNPLEVETQHLTHLYERKLAALEELKKTLLHQAFNGEL
jgi:type I restriction enzyme S subunit